MTGNAGTLTTTGEHAMTSPFSGGCACGAVRYECTDDPLYMGNCHCRDCQRATGSAYFAAVLVKQSALTITGDPRWYESAADRGHVMRRAFCPECGSPVFLDNTASKGVLVLYAGSLDDPSSYAPSMDIFVASAQPWDHMDPALPKHDGMPRR